MMVCGDWGIIPAGLGWSLFRRDVLTIWVSQNMKKEGIVRKYYGNLTG